MAGRICVQLHGQDAVFTELSSAYPLKLLSTRQPGPTIASAYLITYGGGLVSGDEVVLCGEVGEGATLLLQSQGSTKVFKHRPGQRASSVLNASVTKQEMEFTIRRGGMLLLLPDPCTCFEAASYAQIQLFKVEEGGSLVVLDWVTSGRKSRGEEWAFARYFSVNEIVLEGRRVAKDVLSLEGEGMDKLRAAPYGCYATVFLVGPKVVEVSVYALRKQAKRRELEDAMARTKEVFKTYKPVSPGIRHLRRPLNPHIWTGRPVLPLTVAKRKSGGRNSTGRITVRHRGGGHRQRIRILDFKREEPGIHDVVRIEYDPNRSAHIALLKNRNPTAVGTKKWSYIIAPQGVRAGDEVQSFRQGIPDGFVPGLETTQVNTGATLDDAPTGEDASVPESLVETDARRQLEQSSAQSLALGLLRTLTLKPGNVLPLRLIPVGTVIHNIALTPKGPGVLMRSAGSAGQVVNHEENSRYTHVLMQSGEIRKLLQECCATIGRVSNPMWKNRSLGKAGRARWLGKRPSVRGVAMNANDHPHGGGRGKSKSNKHPVSIWGWGAKGTRTRKPGPKGPKNSNKLVVRERPRGKSTRIA
ncbi:Ribosomal-L2-C domain-containing protein [Mycena kentingensis (nom. inval.)]|nr:Ribosomal-L2-C domain-containing protein [Mycena kentingensis (nom. inval.)]